MNAVLNETIQKILTKEINQGRKAILQPLIDLIQEKVNADKPIHINFICTHNSRRSHLCQVWAQVASAFYQTQKVYCYSGGTEETALFPKVAETLAAAGIDIQVIAATSNPIYAIKYNENTMPIIGFSKKYDDSFNPQSEFTAVMTCSQANGGCPFIPGAEKRIPITYEDPKIADNTNQQDEVYQARSLEIASEMFYVFSMIKSS
ncbi:protein-tyrosine-phosphatase [Sphingobacterium sp. SRCM116780]|uniref:arsenate-mycothiol transferase ArsC n=1 Tax=Sphingobacterium sp. SRCM116780 TaxID=2907623 RepID=UPI001F292142|nr:protein-tyrosine-phosphatase [Sphingobacterium sp. SRCM116780]UIR56834.1 protein-tyrosine-phosphatase [Sphingobacterium sp. SRCM116780]